MVCFQTTQFTCGPSALMQAMRNLDPAYKPDRLEELLIWRASNLVFMGEGQAGCGVFGLAQAAMKRKFGAEIYAHKIDDVFTDRVRHPDEADAQMMMDEHDRTRFLEQGGRLIDRKLDIDLLTRLKNEGKQPVILTEDGDCGHWVLADKVAAEAVKILDPYRARSPDVKKTYATDNGVAVVPHDDFLKLTRVGPQRATVVLALSKKPRRKSRALPFWPVGTLARRAAAARLPYGRGQGR